MYRLWTLAAVLTLLIISLMFLSKVQRVRSAFVALITYLATISPPASLYLRVLDVDALTTRYHQLISEASTSRQDRTTTYTRVTHALEARHQSELAHLHRSIAHLKDLLDESRDRETRQKRRVQRKVGQERKLSVALGEQLTIAHASSAQARRRVFEISQVCGRVQGSNARLSAENDELRAVGGEVLDDNERLLEELHLALCETARYRAEISHLEAALEDQEASARSTETTLREQLDRLKASFASLEEIADDARAELVECKDEISRLNERLQVVGLSEAYDGDVSDFELEKTLLDADVLSEADFSSCAADDLRLRKFGSESPASACAPAPLPFNRTKSNSNELRSTLDRLRSLLPTNVTVQVVAVSPPSSSSLGALDLAYRHAAEHLSYDDLLALDFPSFSSLSSFDGDTCNLIPQLPTTSPTNLLTGVLPTPYSDISSESPPSSSTSAPSLPLFTNALQPELDPFDADPMLAIPTFRLAHSAPPSPRRVTRYAQDLEYLCLQKSTSLPRAIDELALGLVHPAIKKSGVERLLDVKMPLVPKLKSMGSSSTRLAQRATEQGSRVHVRACTEPLVPSTSSSSTTSLPLFASSTPPGEADPFTDPMLAIPLFRLTSSAPPTPQRASRSDKHLERMTMRASTSLPEPLDEILPQYDVPKKKSTAEERLVDVELPWGEGLTSGEFLDEFDAVGVPPMPRAGTIGRVDDCI